MTRRFWTASAVFLLCAGPAAAHDQWANGEPVPEWVKNECCGVADAHHLAPSQVHTVPGGYRVDGYRDEIPEAKMLPSPDGSYWIFYRDLDNGDQSIVYCFFGPLKGV